MSSAKPAVYQVFAGNSDAVVNKGCVCMGVKESFRGFLGQGFPGIRGSARAVLPSEQVTLFRVWRTGSQGRVFGAGLPRDPAYCRV